MVIITNNQLNYELSNRDFLSCFLPYYSPKRSKPVSLSEFKALKALDFYVDCICYWVRIFQNSLFFDLYDPKVLLEMAKANANKPIKKKKEREKEMKLKLMLKVLLENYKTIGGEGRN